MIRATEQLARLIPRKHPELNGLEEFRKLKPTELDDLPTLHLDDISEISLAETRGENQFYQDQAHLRAFTNDVIATCSPAIEGYDEYCRDLLKLGSPEWIRPTRPQRPLRIVEACWQDNAVRKRLCHLVRSGQLACLHPHMGTLAVWELAQLLLEATGVPLKVIAPPPRLTRWVNNKVAFMETVQRLFGREWVPATRAAFNLALLAKNVRELANRGAAIGLKLPDSAGGEGNVVLPTESLRGKSLTDIERQLRTAVASLNWQADRELLVDVWEANVINSPSCQTWIPPMEVGPPIVEGLFVQATEGSEGSFCGAAPAEFSHELTRQIVDHCWLLAVLFQQLGYVGRCSFDLILIGDDGRNGRLKFIECNGRWGGTSLPMTLMNRLFGDFARRQFEVRIFQPVPGLNRLSFVDLLSEFRDDLYDARSGRGSLIFYNPGRIRLKSGVSVIILGDRGEEARTGVLVPVEKHRSSIREDATAILLIWFPMPTGLHARLPFGREFRCHLLPAR